MYGSIGSEDDMFCWNIYLTVDPVHYRKYRPTEGIFDAHLHLNLHPFLEVTSPTRNKNFSVSAFDLIGTESYHLVEIVLKTKILKFKVYVGNDSKINQIPVPGLGTKLKHSIKWSNGW